MIKFIAAVSLCLIGLILVSLIDPALHQNYNRIGFALLGSGIVLIANISFEFIFAWYDRRELPWPLSVMRLFYRSGIRDAHFDQDHSGKIVSKSLTKSLYSDSQRLWIMGTTLHSLLGDNGLLLRMLEDKDYSLAKQLSAHDRKIRLLILNPYSMPGIVRSISESAPFDLLASPIERLMSHLEGHAQHRLYVDFGQAIRNIKKVNKKYDILECRLYSCVDPFFSAIGDRCVISEALMLSDSNKPNEKLSGKMPLFYYNGGAVANAIQSYP